MTDIAALSQAWIEAKARETKAIDQRRAIEDSITAELKIDAASDGSSTAKRDGYVIKATCRLNHKIDSDALQQAAHDAGIGTDVLSGLFRWKPEIKIKEWKAAAPDITGPLCVAITTTAGRPSFSITKEGE